MQIMKFYEQNKKNPSSDITFLNQKIDIKEAATILKRLAQTWNDRAKVKQFNFGEKLSFDESADDFLLDLLPFNHHSLFVKASEEEKKKILTCGWIIYNYKTFGIETDIINPACVSILSGKVPGLHDAVSKEIVSETMIDESYHVLLVMNAIAITNQTRNISLRIPSFNLVKKMKNYKINIHLIGRKY